MDAYEQEVIDILAANSNELTYPALLENVAGENRKHIRRTLVNLKARGLISRRNEFDKENGVVLSYVTKVG